MQLQTAVELVRGCAHPARRTQGTQNSWIVGTTFLALACAILCDAASARAENDFRWAGAAWNGLSGFLELARAHAVEVATPDAVDLAAIAAQDGIILIHPTDDVPVADLSAFMRDGGRLAIVDDFGTGDAVLDNFGIERGDVAAPPQTRRLRGNRNVLIATPGVGHPLTDDVRALVTNHAQQLRHPALEPLFVLQDDGSAIVLAGAVAAGRLVAVGDGSVLINNMLEFAGNRRFAQNLASYVGAERRLWVVTGDTRWQGRYRGAADAPVLASLRSAFERLSSARLTRAALSITTLVIAAALLLFAATVLPRYANYVRSLLPPAAPTVAGLAGRVQYYGDGHHNLLAPLMTYKLELESRLAAALRLGTQVSPEGVESALRKRGAGSELLRDAPRLLEQLRVLDLAQSRPASPPVVSEGHFREMVARGDRILEQLEPDEQR